MAETFAKKELQKKRAKRKEDKAHRREERKSNNDKGKSLDEMIAYLDEDGNLTTVHPDKQIKKSPRPNRNDSSASNNKDEALLTGTVSLFFPDKGYGFITEDQSLTNLFVHSNNLMQSVKEKDRVQYKKEKTPKGFSAVEVKIIK